MNRDIEFMRQALKEAELSLSKGEVPIGAVVVSQNRVIARGHNLVETLNDPTAHAEMLAITAATNAIGGKYLEDCTLYVTLEPCPMCATASSLCHIGRIVFGASDSKRGYSSISDALVHPKTEVMGGIMEYECSEILTTFFQKIRAENATIH